MYYPNQIVQVNGENGAKAYQLPPNSSVILLDTSQPLIWVKVTDGAGYPSLSPYSITPYTPPEPIDINDVLRRLEKLENEQQSNTQPTRKRKSEPVTDDTE